MPNPVLSSVETLGGLGLFCAIGLVIARRFLHVSEDPRVKEIESILPGINCGACGFSGCRGYAEALLEKGVKADCCAPGGEEVAGKLARFLGRELSLKDREVSVLICQGGTGIALEKYTYQGIKDCRAALLVQNGPKVCPFGCVGLGTCAAVCPFDAITMGEDNLPVIDPHKCTACGICVRECPRMVLELLPRSQKIYLACASHDSGKTVKEYCSRGCFTCRICVNPKIIPGEKILLREDLPEIQRDKIGKWEEIRPALEKCPAHSYLERK